ncbi:glutaredoxin domain protein [Bacteriovorax sp. BAL6_X]|uniref:glutathione peroxidase n=1 Tax=Bacteriovorax sp. BAL6_X TaxID=1201290 RepID=UPI00038619E3|nr:glutathione peroxidase [Bacteriovorax sp. BAL6_X]EPZ51200.1 glutaredoxin domain protein [Bacteriovorax sp. BAL6_X]
MTFESIDGKQVPKTSFKVFKNGGLVDLTYDEVFKGKRVVVFSLPGAYTPTCSSTHLPRYNELAGAIKKEGVDAIYVLSVNDAFVMDAWIQDQHAEEVGVLPDGNGDFSKGIGLLVDKSDIGFGTRTWRYSMVVNDGVVEKSFIEPDKPGDPFEVSDADTMLNYLNPEAKKPEAIAIITRPGCPHCHRAKELLIEKGHKYNEIILGQHTSNQSLFAITGQTKVPQIFINGERIGGRDKLEELNEQGKL